MKMFGECLSALWVPRPYGAYVPVCSGAPSGLHGWACVGPHPTVRAEPVEASDPDVGLAPRLCPHFVVERLPGHSEPHHFPNTVSTEQARIHPGRPLQARRISATRCEYSIVTAEILRDYRAPLALRSQHCRTAPDFPRAEAQDDMSCPLLPLTSHLLPLPLSSSATSPLDFRAASTILKTEVRKCPELESASIRAKNQR